jgi:hypothetical protein
MHEGEFRISLIRCRTIFQNDFLKKEEEMKRDKKKSLRRFIGLSAMGSLLLLANVSARTALADTILSITPFFSHAEIVPTSIKTATCLGANGEEFTFMHLKGQGPITASDPRMDGTFFANAKLLHNSQGVGISQDDFQIRDSQTGRLKAKGIAQAMDSGAEPIKAMVTADLVDGTRLWTESTVRLPAPGSQDPIIIEYGGEGPGIPADRGLLISGDCQRFFGDDD